MSVSGSSDIDSTGNFEINEADIDIELIQKLVRTIDLVDQMRGSQKDLEDMLKFTRDLSNDVHDSWPNTYYQTIKLLKLCGFTEPKSYHICFDGSHPQEWSLLTDKRELCGKCEKNPTIPIYYLGIKDRIRKWCEDRKMCEKMTYHWRKEKDHWFRREFDKPYYPAKEIWDGTRFAEMSWFWDPDEQFYLPTRCPRCNYAIGNIDGSMVSCPECFHQFDAGNCTTSGDPRNMAFILHWDGFNLKEGDKGGYSTGAIELCHATMAKSDRQNVSEVYPLFFIPCYLLPNETPSCLDPFLKIIIDELEELFINGVDVNYAYNLPQLPGGEITVRCILLCCTADYPAHCEWGKTINGGVRPCRRDHLEGERLSRDSTTYYYTKNRFHARFPHEPRVLDEDRLLMKEVEQENRTKVRQKLAKETGYTGMSIFIRLWDLYEFNYLQDLLFDVMHNLPMNVNKRHINWLITNDVLAADEVDRLLTNFEWSSEIKKGRKPNGLSNRLNFWKAEELQKFMFPVAEVVLRELLPEKNYHVVQLLARINEYIFNCRDGLDETYLEYFSDLIQRFTILLEEWVGQNQCTVTLHNLRHIESDIKRFGHPDNYWCWFFERAVKKYISISHNHKNAEKSFADSEARRDVLKLWNSRFEKPCVAELDELEEVAVSSMGKIQLFIDSGIIQNFSHGILVGGIGSNFGFLEEDVHHILLSRCKHHNSVSNHVHFYQTLHYRNNFSVRDAVIFEYKNEEKVAPSWISFLQKSTQR